jgi:regulator of sirC expression with transglutaminase-like and TPR domain
VGDNREALKDCDLAVEYMPAWAQGYSERAMVKIQLEDPAGALEDLGTAVSLNPHARRNFEGLMEQLRARVRRRKR